VIAAVADGIVISRGNLGLDFEAEVRLGGRLLHVPGFPTPMPVQAWTSPSGSIALRSQAGGAVLQVMALLQKRIISRCNQLGKPVILTRLVSAEGPARSVLRALHIIACESPPVEWCLGRPGWDWAVSFCLLLGLICTTHDQAVPSTVPRLACCRWTAWWRRPGPPVQVRAAEAAAVPHTLPSPAAAAALLPLPACPWRPMVMA
jgi:hypothetical protein